MGSLELKVAILSILALCITAYLNFEAAWVWGFVLLLAIPVLVNRFPLTGYILGAALVLFPIVLLSKGTSSYVLLFSLGVAIYGGFLIKTAHSQSDPDKITQKHAVASSDTQQQAPLLDQLKQVRHETGSEPLQKTLLRLLKQGADGVTLVATGLVSLPTFLALWYFGLKWPLILGFMTFALYLWRITRYPETLSIKNPRDIRWHGLVLCMCCLVWVLIISLVPVDSLLAISMHLPAMLASPAWFEYGDMLSNYLNHIISLITTAVFLVVLSRLPTFLAILLSGWLLFRFYLSLPDDLQVRVNILRWPVCSFLLILIIIWPNLETLHTHLFDWMASYQSEATRLVELAIIGFLPWRIWKMVFQSPAEAHS